MSYFEFSSPSCKSFCILDYFSFNSTFGYLYILCSPTWKHIVDFRKQGKYLLLFSRWVMSNSLWTVARQAPLSIDFPRQEYWSGLLFPTPGDLPNPGIKPSSLVSPTLARQSRATIAAKSSFFLPGGSLRMGEAKEWVQNGIRRL